MSADRTVLLAAIAGDREAMRRRMSAIRAAKERPDWGMDVAFGDHVGTSIHHWYGGVEGVLERLIRAFEGQLPIGDRWHNDLLDQAAYDLGLVRGPILGIPTRDSLRKVLAFRHFFRHAYAAEWDIPRLGLAMEDALTAATQLDADLDVFLAKLAHAP